MTSQTLSRRRIRSIVDHVLIGAVIVLGTSFVTMASNLQQQKPDITLYERVMEMLPGCR